MVAENDQPSIPGRGWPNVYVLCASRNASPRSNWPGS